MHITEGYLPLTHAVGWSLISAPCIAIGLRRLARVFRAQPEQKLLLGACGGFAFVLSALKLPSVTGSCSHPTGMGLGAILFGPACASVLGFVVLLFQALFLAHGGLTTLGANCFSMAIVGSYVASFVYRLGARLRLRSRVNVFLAAALGAQATYVVTAMQLAFAFPDPNSGYPGAAAKFLGIFAITQLPLSVFEGIMTVVTMNLLRSHAGELLSVLEPTKEVKTP